MFRITREELKHRPGGRRARGPGFPPRPGGSGAASPAVMLGRVWAGGSAGAAAPPANLRAALPPVAGEGHPQPAPKLATTKK